MTTPTFKQLAFDWLRIVGTILFVASAVTAALTILLGAGWCIALLVMGPVSTW